MSQRVLFALHRVGPYHRVRLATAAEAGVDLTVLQTRPQSQEYAWTFDPSGPYELISLTGAVSLEADPPRGQLVRQLEALLDHIRPAAIVNVGWADRAYQSLLVLAHKRRLPLVIVSDSRQRDEPRSAAKEWIKRQLLRGYSAALVAGQESRDYLTGLGFRSDAIVQPWDVVDNAFFAQASAIPAPREPHFLCVSRLVAKKNHVGLLQSYSIYQQQGGRWGLKLVGSGPEESSIREAMAKLPQPDRVELLPFCQLEQLCHLYGQASSFVLASRTDQWGLVVNEAMAAGLPCLVSNACGCAVDLIDHGVTGWCFDPSRSDELTALMHTAEKQSHHDRSAMVAAARECLQAYAPQTFAEGLQQAVEWAADHPHWSRRAALAAQLLSLRP